MKQTIRKKILAYIIDTYGDSANAHKLNDEELIEQFTDAIDQADKIRYIEFAGGSAVGVHLLGDLYLSSDDAGIYGPFESFEDAKSAVSFASKDRVVYEIKR